MLKSMKIKVSLCYTLSTKHFYSHVCNQQPIQSDINSQQGTQSKVMYAKWSDIFTYSYLDGPETSFSFGSSDKFFLRLKD